jgi:PAS domain-containing protein
MKSGFFKSAVNPKLRREAEKLLEIRKLKSGSLLPGGDSYKLMHELEVHQIELEMQNEELVLARTSAIESAEKYAELYDFAPSGYFTITRESKIIELNLSGYEMLGKERLFLKNNYLRYFISEDTKSVFNLFLSRVYNSKSKESCEVCLSNNDNVMLYVYITGMVTGDGQHCRLNIVDNTEHRQTVLELKLKIEELTRLNAGNDNSFSIVLNDDQTIQNNNKTIRIV